MLTMLQITDLMSMKGSSLRDNTCSDYTCDFSSMSAKRMCEGIFVCTWLIGACMTDCSNWYVYHKHNALPGWILLLSTSLNFRLHFFFRTSNPSSFNWSEQQFIWVTSNMKARSVNFFTMINDKQQERLSGLVIFWTLSTWRMFYQCFHVSLG